MGKDEVIMTRDEYEFRKEVLDGLSTLKADMKNTLGFIKAIQENGCSRASQHDVLEEKISKLESGVTHGQSAGWATGMSAFLIALVEGIRTVVNK